MIQNTITNFINNGGLVLIITILIYLLSTLYLTYLIYSLLTKKNKITYFRDLSLIKDKDFIFFKDNLFKIYGYISIILFFYLFKSNSLYLIINLDNYFLFFIFLIYLSLISNWFILFLFNIYTNVKNSINRFNNINLDNLNFYNYRNKNISSIFPLTYLHTQARGFSASCKIKSTDNSNLTELELEILPDHLKSESSEVQLEWFRQRVIENFKKAYGGGYLGYTKIHNFGNITQFVITEIDSSENDYQILSLFDSSYLERLNNLNIKLKGYTIEIPENLTYSILPVIRWETSQEKFHSVTISDSIKITRDINTKLIAEKLIHDILAILRVYSLRDLDLDLLILGRPWLSVDEFNFDRFLARDKLTSVFDEIIEKKILAWSKSFNINNSLDKLKRLKNYLYKDVYMDNYGDSVLDKKKK